MSNTIAPPQTSKVASTPWGPQTSGLCLRKLQEDLGRPVHEHCFYPHGLNDYWDTFIFLKSFFDFQRVKKPQRTQVCLWAEERGVVPACSRVRPGWGHSLLPSVERFFGGNLSSARARSPSSSSGTR